MVNNMNQDIILNNYLCKYSQIPPIPYTHIVVPSYYLLGNSAVKVINKLGFARGIEVEDVSGGTTVVPADAFTTPITAYDFAKAVNDYRRTNPITTVDPNTSPLTQIKVIPNPSAMGLLMSDISDANPETIAAMREGLLAGGTPVFRKNDPVNATVSFIINGEPKIVNVRADRLLVQGTTTSLKDWMLAHQADLQKWEADQAAAKPKFIQNIKEKLIPRRRYANINTEIDKWLK